MAKTIEAWRQTWRDGFAPILPVEVLQAIASGLEADDPALAQDMTTAPMPHPRLMGLDVEAGCVLCYGFWKAGICRTVGECEEAFANACFEADQRQGVPAACRYFLNWYDDVSRAEMLRQLLPEVRRAIDTRLACV